MCILDPQATDPPVHPMRLNFRILPFETKLHIELASGTGCRVPLSVLRLTIMSLLRGSS